jgi:hydrogenase expression/formation protein HypC
MCLAIPSKVLEIRAGMATIECFGSRRSVSLLLLDEDVAVGDYLLVRAGGYACEKVEEARALDVLALMAEVNAQLEAKGAA